MKHKAQYCLDEFWKAQRPECSLCYSMNTIQSLIDCQFTYIQAATLYFIVCGMCENARMCGDTIAVNEFEDMKNKLLKQKEMVDEE